MAANTILFATSHAVDNATIIAEINSYSKEWNSTDDVISVERLNSESKNGFYSVEIHSPNASKLFEVILTVLQNCGYRPFPNYLLIGTCNSREFSSWQSPYGAMVELLHYSFVENNKQIKVGVLDNFKSYDGAYPHGASCCNIIETVFRSLQQTYQDDILQCIPYAVEAVSKEDILKKVREMGLNEHALQQIEVSLASDLIYTSEILKLLDKAMEDKVDVLNISMTWKCPFDSKYTDNMLGGMRFAFEQLKKNNKCIVILSAGNDSRNIDADVPREDEIPTNQEGYFSLFSVLAKRCSNLYIIAASGVFGHYWQGTNYGSDIISLSAPGEFVEIMGNPNMFTGTSGSAPHCTGAIAVLLREFSAAGITPVGAMKRLVDTQDIVTKWYIITGGTPAEEMALLANEIGKDWQSNPSGKINLARALRKDLIGSYGIQRDSPLLESRAEIVQFQALIHHAEKVEQESTNVLRDKAFEGFDEFSDIGDILRSSNEFSDIGTILGSSALLSIVADYESMKRDILLQTIQSCWIVAYESLENEVETYRKALDLLRPLRLTTHLDEDWKAFELNRIENLIKKKDSIILEWKQYAESDVCRCAFLRCIAEYYRAMKWMKKLAGNEEENRLSLITVYERYLDEVIANIRDLDGNSPYFLARWKYEEFWTRQIIHGLQTLHPVCNNLKFSYSVEFFFTFKEIILIYSLGLLVF